MNAGDKKAAGRLAAMRGLDAVAATERRICGAGAVDDSHVADGLALAGHAAAVLPRRGRRDPEAADPQARAGWVDHRVRPDQDVAEPSMAFELVARDGQQAVDHCLAAQRLALRLRRPVGCTIDREIADRPQLLQLPDRELIAELVIVGRQDATPSVEEAAHEALRATSERTGRPCGPLDASQTDGARIVLLSSGLGADAAETVAAALCGAGLACGTIHVALFRPFPADALRARVGAAEFVVVLSPRGDDRLSAEVRAALGQDRVVDLQATADATALCSTIVKRLDLEPAASVPARDVRRVSLGMTPAHPWSDALLLETAARLAPFGDLALDLRDRCDADVTVVELAGSHSSAPDIGVDTLLAGDAASLRSKGVLDAVQPGGTVVLDEDGESAEALWLTLGRRVHEKVKGRKLRLLWIDRSAVRGSLDQEQDAAASFLRGALVAATPSLGHLFGTSEALIASVADHAAAGEAALLRAGAAALRDLKPVEIEFPAEERAGETKTTPRMPPQADGETPAERRMALSHFHLSGVGAWSIDEPLPCLPLRPAVLVAGGKDGPELESGSLPQVYLDAVRGELGANRASFASEIRDLARRLRDLLQADALHDPGTRTAARLAGSFGRSGEKFFDPTKLVDKLPRPGSKQMALERRRRIERNIAVLTRYVETHGTASQLVFLDSAGLAGELDENGVRTIEHADGLRAAIGLFDGLAATMTEVLRAARAARLELTGSYEPVLHDAFLDRFGWESFDADELRLMPTITVLETGWRLVGRRLAAFTELLRSGRPVQVLVADSPARMDGTLDARGGYHAEPGYLAVSHREAFVLQSSVVRGEHLRSGLRRMVRSLRPAVAVVAVPLHAEDITLLNLAHEGRATPCFSYDPDAGGTWAERFEISDNPEPEAIWPTREWPFDEDADEGGLCREAVTFAHAVAVDPAFRAHFRVLGRGEWNDEQTQVADYLDLEPNERTKKMPYIWIVDRQSRLARAVITRELAYAALDRARAWRNLQELAGTRNAYVLRAVEESRQSAETAAGEALRQVEVTHAAALERSRTDAVQRALERLVPALMELGSGSISLSEFTTATAIDTTNRAVAVLPGEPAAAIEAAAVEATEPPPPPAPAVVEEPFIDSVLCTTCHECININKRLFTYDENQQARIADPTAGTFRDLVKAAEKCPARCIHPGAPRKGDKTATPAMIARAAPFN